MELHHISMHPARINPDLVLRLAAERKRTLLCELAATRRPGRTKKLRRWRHPD